MQRSIELPPLLSLLPTFKGLPPILHIYYLISKLQSPRIWIIDSNMSAACRIPPFWWGKPFNTPQSPPLYPPWLIFRVSFFVVFYIHPWQVWPFGWDCSSRSHSQTVGPGFVAIFKDWDALHECPREVRALSSMAVGPAMKNSTPNAWR